MVNPKDLAGNAKVEETPSRPYQWETDMPLLWGQFSDWMAISVRDRYASVMGPVFVLDGHISERQICLCYGASSRTGWPYQWETDMPLLWGQFSDWMAISVRDRYAAVMGPVFVLDGHISERQICRCYGASFRTGWPYQWETDMPLLWGQFSYWMAQCILCLHEKSC